MDNLLFQGFEKLTDDELTALSFSMPWQYDSASSGYKDPDGFAKSKTEKLVTREELQKECWSLFNNSPHLNTAIRGLIGRLTGMGFETSCEIQEIQDVIEEIEQDQRNRLYSFWPKFLGRVFLEGELFLVLTVHPDGFIEVDFVDPSVITGTGRGGDISDRIGFPLEKIYTIDGVVYFPGKTYTMPAFYYIKDREGNEECIPSIYVAHYPILAKTIKIEDSLLTYSKEGLKKYSSIGGYKRFIISWDRSFLTGRNFSYIVTVIEWLNYYHNLKKYEIDHKKSAGAYLWVVTIEDPKTFRLWLSLSDDDKRKTGIMAKKTPGSTLILPPGMKMTAVNPNLPKISESDTDILHMITSGLNEPEDVATGQSKGTFASVKASRGPMSDRVSDEIAYFERFLRHDFWGNIFFLKSKISSFPEFFKQKIAIDFKDGEAIFKNVSRKPEFLIDIAFPVSEVIDAETRARAYLGVKHGSIYDTLGIPNAEIAKKLGLGNYKRLRLQQATEQERYPELTPTIDADSVQEKKIEPKQTPKGGE